MNTPPHNQLTPAQAERLDYLQEKLSEAITATAKVKRHGYSGNRIRLTEALGWVVAAVNLLDLGGEILGDMVDQITSDIRLQNDLFYHQDWPSLTPAVDDLYPRDEADPKVPADLERPPIQPPAPFEPLRVCDVVPEPLRVGDVVFIKPEFHCPSPLNQWRIRYVTGQMANLENVQPYQNQVPYYASLDEIERSPMDLNAATPKPTTEDEGMPF